MKRNLKTTPVLLLCVSLAGCVNPYEKFFQDYSYRLVSEPLPATNARIIHVGDARAAVSELKGKGYVVIGAVSFSGGRPSDNQALKKARMIGADLVVCDDHFAGSQTVNIPITTYQPGQTYTTSHYGTITSGNEMSSYSGTSYTRTPDSIGTEYIQQQRAIYNYNAVFLKEMRIEQTVSPSVQVNQTLQVTDVPAASDFLNQRYKIALCDWMILKRQKLGAFQLTKDIGADGVEVDMGSLGTNETFVSALTTDAKLRQQFLDKAKELNLGISSIAMSGFYAQSFGNRPTEPRMTQDCIDTMKAMNVKIAYLPICMVGDPISVLKNEEKEAAKGHPEKYMPQYEELVARITERLKALAVKAEDAGVVIGIETSLPAVEELALLKKINSPSIRSYFNFSNALQNGRDLNAKLRTLGKDYICQIHCTDQDGVWLQSDPKIDMAKVKATLDEMGWSGWLVIERSRDARDARNVKKNFGANTAYLKSVFQK